MENFGTGIPRILNAYEQEEKQPVFDPTDNFFRLTLPNLVFNADPINDPILDPLNDFELSLLKIMKVTPGLNAPKLLDKILIQYPDTTIDKVKNALKRHLTKYCEFFGSRSGGGYYLKNK